MRTPKRFKRQFKNCIVTDDMLGACAYSCEKRERIYCNKMRHYRRARKWFKAEEMNQKMEEYEIMKETILDLYDPICIHVEEVEFNYCDDFCEYTDCVVNYYLYYEIGGYCFHQLIPKEQIDYTLPIVEIEPLISTYPSPKSLLSAQFCYDVYGLVFGGRYTYIPYL